MQIAPLDLPFPTMCQTFTSDMILCVKKIICALVPVSTYDKIRQLKWSSGPNSYTMSYVVTYQKKCTSIFAIVLSWRKPSDGTLTHGISTCCFENTTDVVFPQRKAYIGTEELKHSPQKHDVEGVFGRFFSP